MTYYNLNQLEFDQPPGTMPFPVAGGAVNVQAALGNSSYNALQPRLMRRMSQGRSERQVQLALRITF